MRNNGEWEMYGSVPGSPSSARHAEREQCGASRNGSGAPLTCKANSEKKNIKHIHKRLVLNVHRAWQAALLLSDPETSVKKKKKRLQLRLRKVTHWPPRELQLGPTPSEMKTRPPKARSKRGCKSSAHSVAGNSSNRARDNF